MIEATVPWWGILPFVAMLACIAILPLVPSLEHHWERNSVKLVVALVLGVPVAIWMWSMFGPTPVTHALWEYVQFISLLLALFVVSGGIFLSGDIEATPRNNVTLLSIGGAAASFIGTTGAAMLLIRPLLRTNSERKFRAHTVVFFIFIVANCGGLLTPLGDPPLFLGFLRGVPFTWTLSLFPEWLFVNALLLLTYYALDCRRHAQESPEAIALDDSNVEPLRVHGKLNFLFIAVIIVAVAALPSIDLEAIEHGTASWVGLVPWRELAMWAAAAGSLAFGDKDARYRGNGFEWAPILEVAALFIGIFLTMIPALRFLERIAPSLPLNEVTFNLFTGALSSLLDNAPTYVTFFEMARALGADIPGHMLVAGVPEYYLAAISTGAVFWGAVTYIGNGPNFMVKAVAENDGVDMPSFGGYIVRSFTYLVPTLLAQMCLFIAESPVLKAIGVAITLFLVVRAVLMIRSARGQRPAATTKP
ncbi:sodium:proton antiporter [Nigerium massiliense]|uniref:sodium:proton antiporter n=1 Tax=Nigerium massiliense TaxID=1522317 RepID=UPI00058D3116|nr:sodium:proton antiporter [Nigerium massiliense]